MVRRGLLLVIVVLLALALPGWAVRPAAAGAAPAALDTAAIDAVMEAQLRRHGLPGAALAVVQGSQVVYLQGYGSAGPGRAMTPQTPMYIGSQSKSFTGLAVAQLVSAGKLRLNDPVQRHLPWFRVADPRASAEITINHLLHHRSGMSEAGWTVLLPEDAGLETAVRSLSSARLTAPVGEQFQYFNMGYAVLMLVVEAASGQPYDAYLREHILAPLQMARTYTHPAQAAGLAQGYGRLFGQAVPVRQPHLAYQLGAGYIISTAEDLGHYAVAMLNQGRYAGQSVLPAARMQILFAPLDGYGMGWFVGPEVINHGGANEAFRTEVNLYPRQQTGIVLLINEGSMFDHYIMAPQVIGALEAAVLGRPQPTPGWAIPAVGRVLLAAVLALLALHAWTSWNMRGWAARARAMPPARRAVDVALSFVIPTVILLIVYTQVKAFMGYRMNLTYQLVVMARTMPEVAMLLVLSSLPDYTQGVIKLFWVISGKAVPARREAAPAAPAA